MEQFRSYLEILYFISSIIIAIAAVYGLKQLKLTLTQIDETKETRKKTALRESYNSAAEQCKYFVETILPKLDDLDDIIANHKLDFFLKSKVIIKNTEISITPYIKDNAINKVIEYAIYDVTHVLNALESFSIYFVSGVADDNIGFNALGSCYVKAVKRLCPLACISEDHFKHIRKLLIAWNSRIEEETLIKEQKQLLSRLEDQKTITFNSIGLD